MRMDTATLPKYKWLYLLPNLFTTLTLSAGFYAIVMTLQGETLLAAFLIFFAFFADGFDGATARITHTQSRFGAEYDSFSDLVAFGLAPAILIYVEFLFALGQYSWLIALLYVVAVALRLARFNLLASDEKYFFRGLPCPIAAGMMVSAFLMCRYYHIDVRFLMGLLTVVLSLLMVSSFRYYSIRVIDSKMKGVILGLLLFVAIGLSVSGRPEGFFGVFLLYTLSTLMVSFR